MCDAASLSGISCGKAGSLSPQLQKNRKASREILIIRNLESFLMSQNLEVAKTGSSTPVRTHIEDVLICL